MSAQGRGVEGRRPGRCPCRPRRVEVDRLAADHAGRAGGVGDDRRASRSLRAMPASGRRLRGSRASSANASVCRPSPARMAMPSPNDDVQRRPAAPQVVVVHRRQVVVDERVGVDHLERAGRRHGQAALRPSRRCAVERRPRRPPAPAGPQPLAAGEAGCSAWPRPRRAGRRAAPAARGRAPGSTGARGGRVRSRRTAPPSPVLVAAPDLGRARARRVQLAALVEDLDAALGVLEPRVAEARQLHAALVERERLLERQVALLELLDDASSSAMAASKSLMVSSMQARSPQARARRRAASVGPRGSTSSCPERHAHAVDRREARPAPRARAPCGPRSQQTA